jgi:septal ring factor EnvC (AmiA/AmiB activator)
LKALQIITNFTQLGLFAKLIPHTLESMEMSLSVYNPSRKRNTMINSYVQGKSVAGLFAGAVLCLVAMSPAQAAGQSRESMQQMQQNMNDNMNTRNFDQQNKQLKLERERVEAELALKKKNAAAAAEAAKAAEAAEAAKSAAPAATPAEPPKG